VAVSLTFSARTGHLKKKIEFQLSLATKTGSSKIWCPWQVTGKVCSFNDLVGTRLA